jgi:hypothetical protein
MPKDFLRCNARRWSRHIVDGMLACCDSGCCFSCCCCACCCNSDCCCCAVAPDAERPARVAASACSCASALECVPRRAAAALAACPFLLQLSRFLFLHAGGAVRVHARAHGTTLRSVGRQASDPRPAVRHVQHFSRRREERVHGEQGARHEFKLACLLALVTT